MQQPHSKNRSVRVVGRLYALLVTSLALFLASFIIYPLPIHRVVAEATVDLIDRGRPSATEVKTELTEWLNSSECIALAVSDLQGRKRLIDIDVVGRGTQVEIATTTNETTQITRVKLTLAAEEEALATDLLEALTRQVGEGGGRNGVAAIEDQNANEIFRRASAALQEARLIEGHARRRLTTMLEEHFDETVDSTHVAEPTEREASPAPTINPQWEALHRQLQQLTATREQMGHEMTARHPLLIQTDYELTELRRRLLETPQFLFDQGAARPSYPGYGTFTVTLSEPLIDTVGRIDPAQPPANGGGERSQEDAKRYDALREQWQQSADALQQAEQAMHEAREGKIARAGDNQPVLVTVVEPPHIVRRSGASLSEFRLITQAGIALMVGLLVAWRIGRPVQDEMIRSVEALQKAVSLPIVDAVDPATKPRPTPRPARLAHFALRLAEVTLIVVIVLAALAATSDRCLAEEIIADPLTGLSHVTSVLFPL